MNVTIEIDNQAPQKNNLMDLASDPALGKTVVESEAKGAHDFYRSNGKGRGVPDLIQKKPSMLTLTGSKVNVPRGAVMKANKLWVVLILTLMVNGGAFLGFGQVSAGSIARSIECRHWIAHAAEMMRESMFRGRSSPANY